VFRLFEKLLHPYPETEPDLPPEGFFAFMWACMEGLRQYIVALAFLSALVSGFEAWLFSVLGQIVDWAAKTPPERFLAEHGPRLGASPRSWRSAWARWRSRPCSSARRSR
jgi:ATP-binding cassette, subfamily B, multidrug efflux pump